MSLGVDISLAGRLVPGDGKLLKMAEHYDQFITSHELANPMVWRDRIPKGTFPLFNGTSQTTNIFRGTLGPQAGLSEWTAIGVSRKASGNDAGFDACSYTPQTYTWGVDTVAFGGLRTSWTSPVFCVNDLKYTDKAKEQLALIVKAGSRVTDDVKEVFSREQYVATAVNAGKAIILSNSGMDYIDDPDVRFTYNPFVKDSDGDTYITFPASQYPNISTLNWSYLDRISQILEDQAPEAAISSDGGMPVFGLMVDAMDFEKYVLESDKLREDFRFARPQQLISGFNMGFKVYRRYALIHDRRQMRFQVSSRTATTITAKRVLPRRAIRAGTIGYIPEANPDYYKAELAIGVIFMNDVIQILVPSTVNNMGSGMVFGPAPGFNGEWKWINEYDKTLNPLRETGHFFARFEYFVKPLIHSSEARVFLYRRCPQGIQTGCEIEGISEAAAAGTAVSITETPVAGAFDATNRTVTLTLAKVLAGQIGDTVTIKNDSSANFTATIVDASMAPVYTFAWVSGATNAPTAVTEMNDPAIVTVTLN